MATGEVGYCANLRLRISFFRRFNRVRLMNVLNAKELRGYSNFPHGLIYHRYDKCAFGARRDFYIFPPDRVIP